MSGKGRKMLVRRVGPQHVAQVTTAGIERIGLLAALGMSNAAIAASSNMDVATLRSVRKRQPAVDQAITMGRALLWEEVCTFFLERMRKGDTTSAMFFAKARLHWRDNGQPVVVDDGEAVASQVNVTFVLPTPISRAQLADEIAAIDVAATEAPR